MHVDIEPWPAPPGVTVRPTRLGELMPVATRTDAEIGVELQRIEQMDACLAAYKVELVSELARRRPDSDDRQIGEPGAASPDWLPGPGREPAAGVSEFFADELAIILNCSRTAATKLADQAALLTQRMSATWAALADGRLDWPRARAIASELMDPARDVAPHVLAAVEAAVLPRARERSVSALQAAVRKELLRLDAAAADRRRKRAERSADVTVRPAGDGMAHLSIFAPAPFVAAIHQSLDQYARTAKTDGDGRTLGQLRVGVLGDLVLRPWDETRPPVTAHLTVLASLDALIAGATGHDGCAAGQFGPQAIGGCRWVEPAEIDGQPITAAHLRSLLEQLDALCPGGLQAPTGGTLDIALTDPLTGALLAVVSRAELERLAGRGCPTHPDEGGGCPVLDRPPPVDRYRPTPAQRRFGKTRDRTCRHPGCRNDAAWADLDHVVPHAAGGETSCDNLCCLCRRHHRLKTHAAGWRFVMTADGVLSVTTPSGVTRTTRPPGYTGGSPPGESDDPPPF